MSEQPSKIHNFMFAIDNDNIICKLLVSEFNKCSGDNLTYATCKVKHSKDGRIFEIKENRITFTH